MAYKPARTIKERRALAAEHRARVRAWRPTLDELFPSELLVKNRVPTATKKGPGRVPLSLVVATRRKRAA